MRTHTRVPDCSCAFVYACACVSDCVSKSMGKLNIPVAYLGDTLEALCVKMVGEEDEEERMQDKEQG